MVVNNIIKEVGASLGYSRVKEEQCAVVMQLVDGKDVFATLPTGFGKSLCFASLPGVFDVVMGTNNSIVVVISPLIAIMKDQVLKICVI